MRDAKKDALPVHTSFNHRLFDIKKSLTLLSAARDGLTVGKASRIHCSRVRMTSFETWGGEVSDGRKLPSSP